MIEVIRTYSLDYDDLHNDNSASLASMTGGSTHHQSIVSTVELAGSDQADPWTDDDAVGPLTTERKRVASAETGSESPPKRTLTLRGTQMWKAMYPRDE